MSEAATLRNGSPSGVVRAAWFAAALAALFIHASCSTRTTNLVTSQGASRDGGVLDGKVADASQGPRVTEAGITICGDHICACANGKEDDADGLIDGFDPECTGSFDDDESSFASGVHGEDREARCQDCYFDGNSGPGDDGCRRASSCATEGTAASGSGICGTCTPTTECVDRCLPKTPNGCDCFGCCEVRTGASTVSVVLRDTCSLASIGDAALCPRCKLSADCVNPCGRCELCPGKTIAELPADCPGSGGLDYSCDSGTACGPAQPCSIGSYCIQGCCVPILI